LNITDESTCDIKQSTDLVTLLNKTSLILWDEAPMAHRNCFEALDKSLRDILRYRDENSDKKPFGGMLLCLVEISGKYFLLYQKEREDK
jgi:hypothetical protein